MMPLTTLCCLTLSFLDDDLEGDDGAAHDLVLLDCQLP
jgi:hypothetical protein